MLTLHYTPTVLFATDATNENTVEVIVDTEVIAGKPTAANRYIQIALNRLLHRLGLDAAETTLAVPVEYTDDLWQTGEIADYLCGDLITPIYTNSKPSPNFKYGLPNYLYGLKVEIK